MALSSYSVVNNDDEKFIFSILPDNPDISPPSQAQIPVLTFADDPSYFRLGITITLAQ